MYRCSLQFEAKEVAVGAPVRLSYWLILVVITHAVAFKEGNDCISRFKDLAKIYQMPEGKMDRINDNESPHETKDWPMTNITSLRKQ